jgi:hypothetical protein
VALEKLLDFRYVSFLSSLFCGPCFCFWFMVSWLAGWSLTSWIVWLFCVVAALPTAYCVSACLLLDWVEREVKLVE